jgi:hypothetical protein
MYEHVLPNPNLSMRYWSSSQSALDPAEAYWWYGVGYGVFEEMSVLKNKEVPFRPIRAL